MSPTRLLLAIIFLASSVSTRAQAPDLILRNGHIYTGDPATPFVEAIAIRGDQVLAVGPNAIIVAAADKHTQVIDLGGRMAMPGINDAHDHVGGANCGIEVRTKPTTTQGLPDPPLAEVADAIREAAATASPGTAPVAHGTWIHADVGVTILRHPQEARAAIDTAAAGHPVMLIGDYGHGVILNTAALAKLGLSDSVKDPLGGRYDRDANGHLTGLLEEYAGSEIKGRICTPAEQTTFLDRSIQDFRGYAQHRLAQGVTSVQIMGTNAPLPILEQTFVQAQTPLRIRIMRFPFPGVTGPLGHGDLVLSPTVRVAGTKYVLDGTPLEELAWQSHDYPDHPGWRGRPNFSVDFLRTQLSLALTGPADLTHDQLLLHIVGDATTNQVLDEMEKLAPAERWRPLRVRFEHGDGFITPESMARAHQLGIVIAQPRPGRPFRALLDAGIPLAYGSDGGMAPWFMFFIMTNPHDPNHITPVQALSILTSGSAFSEFQEKTKGTLAPGMLADIAVLSQDVTATPAMPLPATHSVLTLVGGKIVFTSPEFH